MSEIRDEVTATLFAASTAQHRRPNRWQRWRQARRLAKWRDVGYVEDAGIGADMTPIMIPRGLAMALADDLAAVDTVQFATDPDTTDIEHWPAAQRFIVAVRRGD